MNNNDNMTVCLTTETTIIKYAEVIVNGESKGKRVVNGTPSLSQFATDVAREFGIKAFTVTVDDSVVSTTAQAQAPLPDGAKVEVAAKETRGTPDATPATGQATDDAGDAGDEDDSAEEVEDEGEEVEEEGVA